MISFLSKILTCAIALSGLLLFGCLAETGNESTDSLGIVKQEVAFNGHDYLFVTTPQNWHSAQTYCFNYGGGAGYHLATINDATEESFLNNSEIILGKSRWWIGPSDEGIEGT